MLKFNEDELRVLQKVNSIWCIKGMRILPKEVSRFDMLLCQMVYMPLVRPTLANDIKKLEADCGNSDSNFFVLNPKLVPKPEV
jgi:hypothetical protein